MISNQKNTDVLLGEKRTCSIRRGHIKGYQTQSIFTWFEFHCWRFANFPMLKICISVVMLKICTSTIAFLFTVKKIAGLFPALFYSKASRREPFSQVLARLKWEKNKSIVFPETSQERESLATADFYTIELKKLTFVLSCMLDILVWNLWTMFVSIFPAMKTSGVQRIIRIAKPNWCQCN